MAVAYLEGDIMGTVRKTITLTDQQDEHDFHYAGCLGCHVCNNFCVP